MSSYIWYDWDQAGTHGLYNRYPKRFTWQRMKIDFGSTHQIDGAIQHYGIFQPPQAGLIQLNLCRMCSILLFGCTRNLLVRLNFESFGYNYSWLLPEILCGPLQIFGEYVSDELNQNILETHHQLNILREGNGNIRLNSFLSSCDEKMEVS